MKKPIMSIITVILICGVAVAGCGKKKSSVLAKVNDEAITVGQLDERISRMPSHYQEVINKNKRAFLDELIVDMLLYDEAEKKKLQNDKEVAEVIEEARKKIMIARLLKDEVSDKIELTDEEVAEYYTSNREKFMRPEILRASHILVKTEGDAQSILAELGKGKDFEELAKLYSLDPTAKNGGDIGEFKRGDLVPAFEEECFKLEVGEVSGVVKTGFGYHIIKLTDRKKPELESLENVKPSIEDILKQRKRKELFNKLVSRLKDRAKIQINTDLLEEKPGTESAKPSPAADKEK